MGVRQGVMEKVRQGVVGVRQGVVEKVRSDEARGGGGEARGDEEGEE